MARGNANMVIGAVVLLGGGWLLLSRKAAAATPGSSALTPFSPTLPPMLTLPTFSPPASVPGSLAPVGSAITAAQAIWSNLTATTGPYSGFVNFPSGSQAAAVFLPWATDGSGNYYTQWAGQIYLVGVTQPDSNGNYTAKILGT